MDPDALVWEPEQISLIASLDDALRFRRAMEISTVGILLFTPTGEILSSNDAFLAMCGYEQEDVRTGRLRWDTLTPPEWKEASARAVQQFLHSGTTVPYEKEYFHRDGSRFWVFIAAKRLSRDEGIAFVLDVTQRKRAEASLRDAQQQLARSESQLQTITDALPSLIAYVDPGLCYLRVNRAYAQYVGKTPADLVGKHMSEFLGAAFPEIEAHLQRAFAGERQQFEVTIPSTLGARQMLAEHVPDVAPEGGVRGVVVQSSDITERKQTEVLLRTAEKLAAVGRLAASMAHEINNPLESVTNLIYLARESDDPAATREYLLQADRELQRVSAITSQTLRFYKQSTRPLPLVAGDVIESVLSIYSGRLKNRRIQVKQRLRASAPVLCFDGEIRQVLSNLVSNALDAMVGDGGVLALRAAAATDWRTGRPGLRFTVADTGMGIPRETLARIWEPFFTTKEIGGTGLGLWISRDIAERHAGVLRVRSRAALRPGDGHHGTVFTLWLPFAAAPREA